MRPIKKVAVLHDLCGVGKAALTNMVPVLSVMGIEVCPIPTILLSTHTGGYGKPAVEKISTQYIHDCANHYVEQGVQFDLIFVGYLGSEGMIEAVEYFLSCFPGTEVIIDPIMGDHGSFYTNFDESYAASMRRLLRHASVILPNMTESCLLTDTPYTADITFHDLNALCRLLQEAGAKDIVMTSVPTASGKKGIAIYEGGTLRVLEKERLHSEYHGTGDIFDGVFVGAYLNGSEIIQAVEQAHHFVYHCILENDLYDFDEREGLMIEKSLHILV